MKILPIPPLPPMPRSSPELVSVLDVVRRDSLDDASDEFEFYWFAREYPRAFRHHMDHAAHRLRTIHHIYGEFHRYFLTRRGPGGVSNRRVAELYWEFEAFLNAVSCALDILVRIVGLAYAEPTPRSFSRFLKFLTNAPSGPLPTVFKKAGARWVHRLKQYRNCFVHQTPPDTLLWFSLEQYSDGLEVRAPIPKNPQDREILAFRRGRR